jgi:hypothetical protein
VTNVIQLQLRIVRRDLKLLCFLKSCEVFELPDSFGCVMVLFLGHARSSVLWILFKFGVFKLLEVLVPTWVILLDWSSMRAMIFLLRYLVFFESAELPEAF